MEFKGTKGEWHTLEKNRVTYIVNSDNVLIAELDYIETLGFIRTIPREMPANAKLIAASKDLLELCLLVHHSFGGGNIITFSDKDIQDFENAINKAIK
jgi:hypothetical protein